MKVLAENRRARYEYFFHDQYEAGLSLQGWEVKSAKAANVSLAESFVHYQAERGELWLKNAYFAPYTQGDVPNQDTKRNRKLLLHRHEIAKIAKAVQIAGRTCVPVKMVLTDSGLIKLTVAVASGKHAYDKKAVIKQRDIEREVRRTLS